ncbi:MAG: hypothetical protein ACQGVC_12660 [Myxococcota bacterium]
MAEAAAPRTVVPLEVRAPVALGLSPLATMLATSALGIGGALVFAFLMRRAGLPEDPTATLGFATRVAVVASLTLGYTIAVWLWMAREQHRDFVELGVEHDWIDGEEDPRSLYALPAGQLSKSRLAGLAGVFFFVGIIEVPTLVTGGRSLSAWTSLHTLSYMLLLGTCFFWAVGRTAYFSTTRARLGPALERVHVDLLDRGPLRVFGRMALRNAFVWVAGLSIAALAFVNREIRIEQALLVVVPIGVAGLAVGISAMLLPMRGIHRRIVAAKSEELARVEAAIRGDAGALVGSRIEARQPPPGLADLVAYRDLIEKAPEWPLDAGSFRRLGLYLLLPIGSWVGGALVERLVGLLLD